MKTIIKSYSVYSYDELSREAKDNAIQHYLESDIQNDIFYEDVINRLQEDFPNSDLSAVYSLLYCQGDGLNIQGELNLLDFIDKWKADKKQKRAMKFYINKSDETYTFVANHRYGYSCKFIDREHIQGSIDEFIEEIEYQHIRDINHSLIKKFFNDMIDYFEELDDEFEKIGYNTIYGITDEEMQIISEINEWEYTEDGEIF